MGSISLVSWIFLLVPQVIENYRNGSAEGVSLAFITIWLLGDIANLIGALWGHLLSTMIALAIYFCMSDVILLSQTIYYNHVTKAITARREHAQRVSIPSDSQDPTKPLLARPRRRSSGARSRHRRSSARRPDSLSAILEKNPSSRMAILRNVLAITGICFAGTLGWFVAWRSGAWSATETNGDGQEMPRGAEMLGYLSALLYLGARIPQIIRNHQNKSCGGLSLLFFLLSLLGNLTYGAGILCHSSDSTYIKDNLPWLIGSLGTMFQDIIIFIQFHIYSRNTRESPEVDSAII
ncbi:vacuolar membrane PQ loop repeat protein [Choiromyces venosus 120613-1]|uniref:Vacuolar membrane PQ loop repeat protein n=1 Tax=Choiromyces venosus 120613-1 TaxID=1336337 RepID=A0A3N4JNT1_9PEZI|nr:vacuolar membrane PQ loop repeat protein [Choiromyces venosus 120613-1]